MKVAINITPLTTNHKFRGIGYYTKHLLESLKGDESLIVEEFEDYSKLQDIDVVHYPWFDLFYHTLPIKKKFPTIVTIHDVIPLIFSTNYPVGIKGKINFYLQRFSLNGCKFIITDSNNSKKDIVQKLGINEDKIVVIPLAADPIFRELKDTEILRIKRKYYLPDEFLLYVGDANSIKNIPFLIEGFNQLIKKNDFKDLKLILVGGVFLKKVEDIDHPELESLKKTNQLIKDYKLEDKIIRPGNLENGELAAFYNLATIYIQPSLYEGFGLPVLQAFACGVPVISSNAGSLKEVGGEAAIYFDPRNIGQFISVLSDVLQNKSLQKKLSKLGFEQVTKFSWEKVSKQTKQVYFDAIKAK